MYISLNPGWELTGPEKEKIDPVFLLILREISRHKSLHHAARATGISYRHAWGLIKKWEHRFGQPMVDLKRGRGHHTRLTQFGQAFLDNFIRIENKIKLELANYEQDLNNNLNIYLNKDSNNDKVLLSASHDMIVSILNEFIKSEKMFSIQAKTQGSLENLYELCSGRCNIAGFHYPLDAQLGNLLKPEYETFLDDKKYKLIILSVRNQGIIIKAGNTKKIKNLTDLCKRSIRYINRQPESGTRIIFDKLLELNKIDSSQVNGYVNEEFTHNAVAAIIAGGEADAGMGLEAAARKFNLGFIPLVKEVYLLAFIKSDHQLINQYIEVISSESFRKRIYNLPGYNINHLGKAITASRLLSNQINML